MTCDELASIWPKRWPRPSNLTNSQHACMVRAWGEENAGVELENYTREQARAYGLKYPSRIKFLRAMLNDAKRDGLVSENVFAALRIAKPRKERYFPSTDEIQALIRAAEEPLRGRIRFSAYTGLRLGEMLAMRPWDLRATRCRVRWQIDPEDKWKPRKGKVKDYWAFIPEPAHSQGLNEAILQANPGDAQGNSTRLWPLTRYEHNKEWNALRKRLELPENFVWHSLRHHAATWFLDQGASFEDVAIQLGHSDQGIQVRETYGHMSREKALDRLEELVS